MLKQGCHTTAALPALLAPPGPARRAARRGKLGCMKLSAGGSALTVLSVAGKSQGCGSGATAAAGADALGACCLAGFVVAVKPLACTPAGRKFALAYNVKIKETARTRAFNAERLIATCRVSTSPIACDNKSVVHGQK